MRHTAVRKPTNVSLDVTLVEKARELGINISRACEDGLEKQVAKDSAERWREENREAIESYNDYIERNGVPLVEFRQF